MGAFEYRQAEEIRNAFAAHDAKYLFIGKSGAILLGYPDTTQDADLFVERSEENGKRLVAALKDLGFALTEKQIDEIERGKDFVQLKSCPSILTWYLPLTASSDSKTLGSDTSRSKVFMFATSTTSSPAKRPAVGPKISNRYHD